MKTLKTLTIMASITVLTALTPIPQAMAAEKGSIELKMIAQQEIVVENEKGEKEIKREDASKVVPGDHVIYTIEYKNVGDENANSIVINNPVPENMHYVPGTANGQGTDIVFSVDGGKSFDKPENLKVVDEDGNPRLATARDYTHVRWTLSNELEAGKMGEVSYRAELR